MKSNTNEGSAPVDHAEPPEFAKWLFWLIRWETWKKYPYIATIAAGLVLFTAYSGISSFFAGRADKVGEPAPIKVDLTLPSVENGKIVVTDIRFRDNDPKGLVSRSQAFNRIQLTFTNKGDRTCVARQCSLRLLDSWYVVPCNGTAGIVETSATFHILIPRSLARDNYSTSESFLVDLKPNETVSVEVIVDFPIWAQLGPEERKPHSTYAQDEVAFLGAPGSLEPILLADFELKFDSGDVTYSEPFCFTLPSNKQLGIGGNELVDPMTWLKKGAENRIGGIQVVKSTTKLNLSKASAIRAAAQLRSPEVESFLSLMDNLKRIEKDLD